MQNETATETRATTGTPKRINLSDLREKIAKGRIIKQQEKVNSVQDQICEIQSELELNDSKENSWEIERKRLSAEIEEDLTALAEARQNQELLEAADEDPKKIIGELEAYVAEKRGRIEKNKEDLIELQKQRSVLEQKIERLKDQLAAPVLAKKPTLNTPSRWFTPDTFTLAEQCREDIKALFVEISKLPTKLEAFSKDKNARTLLTMILAGRVKTWQGRSDINEPEYTVLNRSVGAIRQMCKDFDVGYVDALRNQPKPTDSEYATWADFTADAKKQLNNYFSPPPENTASSSSARFGLVRPAPGIPGYSASDTKAFQRVSSTASLAAVRMNKQAARIISQASIAQVVKTIPARPVPTKVQPAIEKAESNERKMLRFLKEAEVIVKTAGKRVAVLAGQADKNAPTIGAFIEKAFEFQRVRWYGHDRDGPIESLKGGGIDLFIIIPDWYVGWARYAATAKQCGVPTLKIEGHNKYRICQQIARFYGFEVNVPE